MSFRDLAKPASYRGAKVEAVKFADLNKHLPPGVVPNLSAFESALSAPIAPCLCEPSPFQCKRGCKCVGCGCVGRTDARQASKVPRRTTKKGVGATTLAGPVSPSLLRLASAIRWADEKPAALTVHIPDLRVVSEANQRGHWAKGAGRAHDQRALAYRALCHERDTTPGFWLPGSTFIVILTRIGPRVLDDDNLARGFKAVRDGVADWLGDDDGSERLTWLYQQAKGQPAVNVSMWRWEP